jgi:hypothetical protein
MSTAGRNPNYDIHIFVFSEMFVLERFDALLRLLYTREVAFLFRHLLSASCWFYNWFLAVLMLPISADHSSQSLSARAAPVQLLVQIDSLVQDIFGLQLKTSKSRRYVESPPYSQPQPHIIRQSGWPNTVFRISLIGLLVDIQASKNLVAKFPLLRS